MPDVLLLQKDLAKLKITQAGLSPQIVKGTSDTVAPGQVSNEDPPSGTKIGKGSTVTLTVSTGKPKVQVPNVVGPGLDVGADRARRRGPAIEDPPHLLGQQPDTVTAQQPHAGDSVIKGTHRPHQRLARREAGARSRRDRPAVANAKSMLEGQGFQVGRTEVQSDLAQGVVVAETPSAGTDVPRGTKITLSVSKGPATTQVPDVTGMSQSTAESLLTGAGLTPSVVYDPVTDPAQDGIVQSTDPAPGSDAQVGRGRDHPRRPVPAGAADEHDGTTTTTP